MKDTFYFNILIVKFQFYARRIIKSGVIKFLKCLHN